jgi:hypothetical protein
LPSVEVIGQMNTAKSDFRVFELRHILSSRGWPPSWPNSTSSTRPMPS